MSGPSHALIAFFDQLRQPLVVFHDLRDPSERAALAARIFFHVFVHMELLSRHADDCERFIRSMVAKCDEIGNDPYVRRNHSTLEALCRIHLRQRLLALLPPGEAPCG